MARAGNFLLANLADGAARVCVLLVLPRLQKRCLLCCFSRRRSACWRKRNRRAASTTCATSVWATTRGATNRKLERFVAFCMTFVVLDFVCSPLFSCADCKGMPNGPAVLDDWFVCLICGFAEFNIILCLLSHVRTLVAALAACAAEILAAAWTVRACRKARPSTTHATCAAATGQRAVAPTAKRAASTTAQCQTLIGISCCCQSRSTTSSTNCASRTKSLTS